mgnify:CR=1 FL=1|jgi:beta-lysine N6-acetyltransferase
MNSIQIMLGANGRTGEDAQVRHVRLGDPLGAALSTFDFHNKRIKLYEVTAETFIGSEPAHVLIEELETGDRFSKLNLYAREEPGAANDQWGEAGFRREGAIRGFFSDGAEAVIWARYSGEERAVETRQDDHEKTLKIALSKERSNPALPDGYTSRPAVPNDSEQISILMNSVFEDYASDISPEHLSRQIATLQTLFQVIEDADRKLVAAASAELDVGRQVAEITDCVTLPEHRGLGLSSGAVGALHDNLKGHPRINATYSLARADEIGINCVFHRLGYNYTGRLVNNCRMPNGWESMNIWCR